jgi:hypothetical protein
MPMPRTLLPVLRAVLLTGAATTQEPSPWQELVVPGGVLASATGNIGKLVSYRDGNNLHVFSAVTRDWRTQMVGPNATVRLANDLLLVTEPGVCIAFSTHRGTFESLPVSAQATVLNGPANNNDSLWLIADAGRLHTFSGFTGTWQSRPLAANAIWSVGRHTAVLAQGTLVSGCDAFTGQWTDQVVPTAPTVVSADGTAGFASDGLSVHAFSANHRGWRSASLPTAATMLRGDDWVLWYAGDKVLGYSSLRDGFALHRATVTNTALAQDLFALLATPSGLLSYSAMTGDFAGPWAPTGSVVVGGGSVALIDTTNGTLGYSAVLDRARLLPGQTSSRGCAGVAAFAVDVGTGRPALFSALTGNWRAAPPGTLPGDPLLTTTSAGMLTANGALGWSARTGDFVPLTAPGANLNGNPSSAPLVASDGNHLFAFEARAGRWIAVPRAGTGQVQFQIWRTAVVAIDGNTAFGFGVTAGSWSQQVLPEPVTTLRANSESGRVSTATRVFGFAAVPTVVAVAQFPEFRRVQPIGADLRLVLPVPATALAVLGSGRLLAQPVQLPGLGGLHLDGQGTAIVPVAANANGEPVTLAFAVPAAPALVGVQWACQAAVLPVGGEAWLSDPTTVVAF